MKTKEQKRKEALLRNLPGYFDHVDILLKRLPGGEWESITNLNDPIELKEVLYDINRLKILAKEYSISFSGKLDTHDSMLDWSAERILVWNLSGKSLDTFKTEFAENKAKFMALTGGTNEK